MTERVTWRGVWLDPRTRDMMEELAALTGDIYINPTQGSWSGAAASAGTHTGCGAVDLMHSSWSVRDYDIVVREARRVGFAAWHRTPAQANWPRHNHLIAVQKGGKNDRGCLAQGAHNQVVDYYNGINGLAGRGRDDGPREFVGVTWEKYQEDDMALTDKQIEDIVEKVAARVNRTLGDYTSDGKERKNHKDGETPSPAEMGDARLREIERIVRRIENKVK